MLFSKRTLLAVKTNSLKSAFGQSLCSKYLNSYASKLMVASSYKFYASLGLSLFAFMRVNKIISGKSSAEC